VCETARPQSVLCDFQRPVTMLYDTTDSSDYTLNKNISLNVTINDPTN